MVARKGSLGVFRGDDNEVDYGGVVVPQRLRVQSLGLNGDPDMFAELEIRDGEATCVRIEYRRSKDGGRPVENADLHEIADLDTFMADTFLRYSRVIAEFRANGGRVGGQFQGVPLLLIHHHDANTGREYVAPIFYLASPDPHLVYVFATLGGGMSDPHWYRNVRSAGFATIELGTQTYPVSVEELTGEQRDAVYAEQARRYPVFTEYERLNEGVRVIPVLSLRRQLKPTPRSRSLTP